MSNEFDFDSLERREFPVRYQGKNYVLREASEAASVRWRNEVINSRRYNAEGRLVALHNPADAEPLLVSLCLFEVLNDEGNTRNVTVETLKTWPTRFVQKLFAKAKEISDLADNPDERPLLAGLLEREDAPVTLFDLYEYAKKVSQEDEDYKPLVTWLKPTDEELAKNGRSGTMTG